MVCLDQSLKFNLTIRRWQARSAYKQVYRLKTVVLALDAQAPKVSNAVMSNSKLCFK